MAVSWSDQIFGQMLPQASRSRCYRQWGVTYCGWRTGSLISRWGRMTNDSRRQFFFFQLFDMLQQFSDPPLTQLRRNLERKWFARKTKSKMLKSRDWNDEFDIASPIEKSFSTLQPLTRKIWNLSSPRQYGRLYSLHPQSNVYII
jgi:hypothetical protein